MSSTHTLTQSRGIKITVALVVVFMLMVIAGFVYRINQPRAMTQAEMLANGTILLETPRDLGDFKLVDHRGQVFTPERLRGHWTLVFFGFTHCPDICPTTMAFLNQFMQQLTGTEVDDTRVVMISVDPARDSVEQLADYVSFFNREFIGVTGEFLDIHRLATSLNTPFRKVPLEDGDYTVDHGGNVMVINPRGDYHAFFRRPLDLARMKTTYRAMRVMWQH